ncbi:MAG: hypothetical protein ABJL99_02215 [Aliishimia sp.]
MQPLRAPLQAERHEPRLRLETLPPDARALIMHLRMVALACRTKPRTDLFQACALLTLDKTQARTSHAEALMRCLPDCLGKTPVTHRPGEQEISFDEAWLLSLAQAEARKDENSTTFLLASRARGQDCRHLRFLIHSISEYFDQT